MIKIKQGNSYKIGVDEIEGLGEAMDQALAPILAEVKHRIYWDTGLTVHPTEYKSRDGFSAYSENCGGREISLIVPNCEYSLFTYLEYVECDECGQSTKDGEPLMCGYKGQECTSESEGHLDSKIRIWLKFEGIQDGVMYFYLYYGGGNGDAPYFRTKSERTYFETEFKAKSLVEFTAKVNEATQKLLKIL